VGGEWKPVCRLSLSEAEKYITIIGILCDEKQIGVSEISEIAAHESELRSCLAEKGISLRKVLIQPLLAQFSK
jgi:hypothetical protein